MASNDQWPPVTSSMRGGQGRGKNNDSNNKIAQNQQQMVLDIVTEMFDSTIEFDVIMSIAENCNWDLQSTIDALIALSATVDNTKLPFTAKLAQGAKIMLSNEAKNDEMQKTYDFLKMDKTELEQQLEGLTKFEKLKENPNNRMDFCGNISKLDASSTETLRDIDGDKPIPSLPWNAVIGSKKKNERKVGDNVLNTSNFIQKQCKSTNGIFAASNLSNQKDTSKSSKSNDTFCGLKVHYRQSGTESSDDDDADVVVEKELNDYTGSIPINVSQFLSSSIQSLPTHIQSQTAKAEVKLAVSPPKTPRKSAYDVHLDSIKSVIRNEEKILILLRGLPGCGKTTFAHELIASTVKSNVSLHIICSDDYMTLPNGVYRYDPTKLSDAHADCQKRVHEAIKEGRTPIIVANTNLQAWEMKPYAALAVKYSYIVEVLEINTPWAFKVNVLARKNIHGVPKDKIKIMLERYERGISGDKLLEMFALKYPSNMMPRRIKKRLPRTNLSQMNQDDDILSAEDMETLQKIENLPELNKEEEAENNRDFKNENVFGEYTENLEEEDAKDDGEELKEEKKFGSKADDYLLQPLGAIGCERKNSLVNLEAVFAKELNIEQDTNDIVLSQSWDFTLCLDGETLHSDHNNDFCRYKKSPSPINAEDMRKQDEEFGKEFNNEEPELINVDNNIHDEDERMEEFFRRLTEEYNENPSFEPKESTVVITEIFDEEMNLDKNNRVKVADLNRSQKLDYVAKNGNNDEDKNLLKNDGDIEILLPDKEQIYDDAVDAKYMEAVESMKELMTDEDMENLMKLFQEKIHMKKSKKETSTFRSSFNIIKTSILGDSKADEKQDDVKKDESVIDKKIEDTSEEDEVNSDFENNREPVIDFSSIENEIKASEVFSDKIETLDVESKESEVPGDNEADKKVDNIDRITWKESPFPLDDVSILKLSRNEQELLEKEVSMVDNSTNTSYYDFNVAYVGGTTESGYEMLDAFNRSINEGQPLVKFERPPMKLMLEKSSMTGEPDGNGILDLEPENQDLPDLMDLFPHISRDYLIEIYENLCQKNFSWAVDVLLEGVPDDVILKVPKEVEIDVNSSNSPALDVLRNCSELPSTLDESKHDEKLESCQETVVDSKNDENKDAGDERCDLEVEEMKLNDFRFVHDMKIDVSDTSTSHSTPSIVQDSIDDEKSPEPEEIIEWNLGFDTIRELENQLGNSGFQLPDGFRPVIHMKKSMAEQLYALWIESMYQQLNVRHEQLDQMLAKDAEYAKKLENELQLELDSENEAQGPAKSPVPNLNEIMDMELALASYKKEMKTLIENEMPNDMASKLSRQMLHESHPNINPETLNEILKAHNGNFKETFETIQLSTGVPITPCGFPRKQESLIDRVKEDNGNEGFKQRPQSTTPIIVVKDTKSEKSLYRDALLSAKNSRTEAQRHFSLRIESLNKAADAYRRGYPEVAAYYSQVARLHSKNSESAHADAAGTLVEAQSLSSNEDILDLHFLFVTEALRALDEFLEYHLNKIAKSNKKSTTVYIVTGRGARSNSGQSKIKPAVTKKLLSRNIKFCETNPGCLKVILHRKNGTD